MEFTLTTPALLFPAISLLFLAYTNRFITLANLARTLHAAWRQSGDETLKKQILNIRYRIRLIKYMQILGVSSFICCVSTMLSLFLHQLLAGEIIFGASLVLLLISLVLAVIELRISIDALEIQLDLGE